VDLQCTPTVGRRVTQESAASPAGEPNPTRPATVRRFDSVERLLVRRTNPRHSRQPLGVVAVAMPCRRYRRFSDSAGSVRLVCRRFRRTRYNASPTAPSRLQFCEQADRRSAGCVRRRGLGCRHHSRSVGGGRGAGAGCRSVRWRPRQRTAAYGPLWDMGPTGPQSCAQKVPSA
jgi:hypothetical protein